MITISGTGRRWVRAAWPSLPARASSAFVWAVWVAMLASTLLFIKRYGVNVPYMDEVENVQVVTGHAPIRLAWLWAQHNEHRVFLSRLILVGLFRLTHDFRAGMYFNVALLATASASMILLARRLRGNSRFTDAVFPVALLNLGQAEVLLLGFAMNLLLPAWIAYDVIRTTTTLNARLGPGVLLRFGLYLPILPLCGGNGLVMVPPLAAWLGGWIVCGWWSGREVGGRQRAIGLTLLLAGAVAVVLYLHGYQRPAHHPVAPSLRAVLVTTLEFLSNVTCPAAPRFWHYSSPAAVLLVALTMARLVVIGWRTPTERPRAAGLLLTVVSLLTVAVAVGVGRSGLGSGFGLASRYVPLAAPLLGALYVTWIVYGPGRIGCAIQFGLFALVCLSLPSSNEIGRAIGSDRRDHLRRVEHGLKGGVPGTWLVAAHGASIYPDLGHLYNFMCMMKSAQVGRFHRFQDDWTASGDVDGDGRADIITGAGAGGSPRVRVFSGAGGAVLSEFLAFDPGFTGGVHVAAGDVDGDGRADIITGAGAGGSPRVRVFSGAGGAVLSEFLAFDPGFTGGVHVAAGDLDRDGRADVITVAGPGGGPDARAFHISGNTGHLVASGVIPLRRNWKLPSPTERDRPLVAGRPPEQVVR